MRLAPLLAPQLLTAAQRGFIEGAEALGATSPANARPLPDLPVLPRGELDDLIELGIVREAAVGRYYVYRSRRSMLTMLTMLSLPDAPTTLVRVVKTLLFWLIMVLIPIVLLQLTGRN